MNNLTWFEKNLSSRSTKLTRDKIKARENNYLFLFDFLSTKTITNTGEKEINALPKYFVEFMNVITGKDPFSLSWTGATGFNQIDKQISQNTHNGSRYEVFFDKANAKYLKCELLTQNEGMEIQDINFGDFGDFKTLNGSKTFKVNTTQRITKDDILTKLYTLPIYNGDDNFDDNYICYIENCINYTNELTKEFIYCELTLNSISTLDISSGATYESHIQFSSLGRGYYFPKLIYDDNKKPIDFTYNDSLAVDKGVRQIQYEITGAFALGSLWTTGYPIKSVNTQNDPILPPRRLFIDELKLPIATKDFKGKIKTNKYTFMDTQITFRDVYNDWRQKRKDQVGDKIVNYQGILETNYNICNSLPNGNNINDLNNIVSDEFLKLLGNDGIVDTKFLGDFTDGQNTIGIDEFNLLNLKNKQFKDLLNIYSLFNSKTDLLPIESNSSTLYSMSEIWYVGKFSNKLDILPNFNWRRIKQNTSRLFPQLQKIPFLIDNYLYDFYSRVVFASNESTLKGKIPLELFDKDDSNTYGLMYGTETCISAFTFTLTDKVILDKWDIAQGIKVGEFKCSSIMIDQTIEENGIKYKFKVGESFETLAPTSEVDYTDEIGTGEYVICSFGTQGLGNGDIRATMFNVDLDYIDTNQPLNYVQYQQTYKTQSQFNSNDLRIWNTIIQSDITSLQIKNDIEFKWPIGYTKPTPPKKVKDIILSDYWPTKTDDLYSDSIQLNRTFEVLPFGNWEYDIYSLDTKEINLRNFDFTGYSTWDEVLQYFDKITLPSNYQTLINQNMKWEYSSPGGLIIRSKNNNTIWNIDSDNYNVLVDNEVLSTFNNSIDLSQLTDKNFRTFGYFKTRHQVIQKTYNSDKGTTFTDEIYCVVETQLQLMYQGTRIISQLLISSWFELKDASNANEWNNTNHLISKRNHSGSSVPQFRFSREWSTNKVADDFIIHARLLENN